MLSEWAACRHAVQGGGEVRDGGERVGGVREGFPQFIDS